MAGVGLIRSNPARRSRRLRAPLLAAACLLVAGQAGNLASAQDEAPTSSQLPSELRGAKIYRLPEEGKAGQAAGNPIIYRSLSYQDINLERLALNLAVSVRPVDRAATVRKIYFEDVRANGVPIHIETFEEEFKLSKKEAVDLPAPLKCSIVFSDLDSVAPLREIVNLDKIQITGQSFIEVKLNPLEKVALRTKRLVIPVRVKEEVPLQMFSGNPLLQMAAVKILDTLSDPSSAAALALAREHLAKVTENQTLISKGRQSLYLVYCQYALRDSKTGAAEKFSQSGTGFVISADGKLVTAKRVVEPWKFDAPIAFLMQREGLEVDPQSTHLAAWPAGATVLAEDGQPDFQTALSTEAQTLKVVKIAPDRMEKQEYQDPDSGEKASVSLHVRGEDDVAILQLVGKVFEPLAFAEADSKLSPDLKMALFGFPFGLSQPQAEPKAVWVKGKQEGQLFTLEHALNPGESGAPLLTADGKVLALCSGTNDCVPIESLRALIP